MSWPEIRPDGSPSAGASWSAGASSAGSSPLGPAGILTAPTSGRRTSGFHRVACHRCGRPTVTAGRVGGYNGAGALCSTCRRH